MAVHGIDHINIKAPAAQLDQAKDFYCRLLGLEAGPYPVIGHGYWLYAGDHPLIHLNALESQSNGPSYFNHVAFACTDPQRFIEKLRDEGVAMDVRVDGSGAVRQIFFKDPLDLRVELNFPSEGVGHD